MALNQKKEFLIFIEILLFEKLDYNVSCLNLNDDIQE